jgi:hypothetical protein
MQKKTKIFLAAGAVALVLAGGVAGYAHANMPWGFGPGLSGGPGMHHMAAAMMDRYDANKDGKISQDEIDQNRTAWLAEFDINKDGTLSLEEFQALWLKARHEMMVREFQMFDKDGNGQVTLEEYKAPMSHMVANLDRNKDGTLGPDDRPMGMHGPGKHRPMGGPGPGPDDGPEDDSGAQ